MTKQATIWPLHLPFHMDSVVSPTLGWIARSKVGPISPVPIHYVCPVLNGFKAPLLAKTHTTPAVLFSVLFAVAPVVNKNYNMICFNKKNHKTPAPTV